MSRNQSRRKCRCCRKFFVPDYRNAGRQKFCAEPDCQKASKVASQRRWSGQKANRDYFRGQGHVQRVREWRKANPGYWRSKKPRSRGTQPPDSQGLNPKQGSCNVPGPLVGTLQDLCLTQDPAFVGLISMVTGSTLQEDIVATGRKLILRGSNILGLKIPGIEKTTPHDPQTIDPSGSPPPSATQLQLG